MEADKIELLDDAQCQRLEPFLVNRLEQFVGATDSRIQSGKCCDLTETVDNQRDFHD